MPCKIWNAATMASRTPANRDMAIAVSSLVSPGDVGLLEEPRCVSALAMGASWRRRTDGVRRTTLPGGPGARLTRIRRFTGRAPRVHPAGRGRRGVRADLAPGNGPRGGPAPGGHAHRPTQKG